MALGRIDIKYRRVACQVPQNLNVIVDQNRGAGGWIRLQVKVCATLRASHAMHRAGRCATHQPVAGGGELSNLRRCQGPLHLIILACWSAESSCLGQLHVHVTT